MQHSQLTRLPVHYVTFLCMSLGIQVENTFFLTFLNFILTDFKSCLFKKKLPT